LDVKEAETYVSVAVMNAKVGPNKQAIDIKGLFVI